MPESLSTGDVILLSAGLAVTLAAWTLLAWKKRSGPLLPPEPRTAVPWGPADIAVIILAYLSVAFVLQSAFIDPAQWNPGSDLTPNEQAGQRVASPEMHPLERVLVDRPNALAWVLCTLSAVVVAPLAEEFFFRLLMQGWIESQLNQWKGLPLDTPCRVALAVSSLSFALLHFRTTAAVQPPTHALLVAMAVDAAVKVSAVAAGIVWLKIVCRATWTDLGFPAQLLRADVPRAVVAVAAIFVPVYAVHLAVSSLAPEGLALDPIPLFFFAWVLGFLYQRTHRLWAPILCHALFNGIPLVMLALESMR